MTTLRDLQDSLSGLKLWTDGSRRAPHKPLLVLLVLAAYARGEGRLLPFADVDARLRELLEDYGPARQRQHPEYPFWRLRNDGFWEVKTDAGTPPPLSASGDATRRALLDVGARAGFFSRYYRLLRTRPELPQALAGELLTAHFPDSLHDDILIAVGMPAADASQTRSSRNPEFRHRVLKAYEYRCAVCGFDVRVGNNVVALEAAHIRWHQAGGPDEENNGVALCSLHHRLFDQGAFTVDPDLRVLVSEHASGGAGFDAWLMKFHGVALRPAIRESYRPRSGYVDWHVREVFKRPHREL